MTNETPSLLGLPLELREIIYREVLLQHAQAPQLLRVCREVYAEAHKFLFQRILIFQSQSALQTWIQEVPQNFFQYVGGIVIELQDVDLTPLLVSVASSSVDEDNSVAPPHTWDVYKRALGNLRRALEKITNVKSFTIRTHSGRQSYLYRDFLEKVLKTIGVVYPGLRELTLDGNMHYQSLTFLRSFTKLKAFSFDGFSASGATETAEILSSLQLTNISLVSQHALLTPTHHQHSSLTSKPQSFDGSVLRTINQLASFSVNERYSATSSALFFTSDILGSLHSHRTLSCLSVLLSHTPEPKALDALEDFLDRSSSIERLELDWPDFGPDVIENYALLSNSLQSFWVRATSMAHAFDILWHILDSREAGDVPKLRRVVLVRHVWVTTALSGERKGDTSTAIKANGTFRSNTKIEELQNDPAEDDSDEENVARAKKELYALGVEVAWCTETS